MKVQDLFEAAKKEPFKSFELEGVEFFDPDPAYTAEHSGSGIQLAIRLKDKKSEIGKAIYDAFENKEVAGFDSKYRKATGLIHWVDVDHGKDLDFLIDGTAQDAEKKLKKFVETFKKDFEKSKKPAKTVKAQKIPSMKVPGCKVTMLESWRRKLPAAIKKLGYTIEMSGEEGESTKYSVAFNIDKKFNIEDFRDKLREELNFDGYMNVSFFDLTEDEE
jgi:hypothetical protein